VVLHPAPPPCTAVHPPLSQLLIVVFDVQVPVVRRAAAPASDALPSQEPEGVGSSDKAPGGNGSGGGVLSLEDTASPSLGKPGVGVWVCGNAGVRECGACVQFVCVVSLGFVHCWSWVLRLGAYAMVPLLLAEALNKDVDVLVEWIKQSVQFMAFTGEGAVCAVPVTPTCTTSPHAPHQASLVRVLDALCRRALSPDPHPVPPHPRQRGRHQYGHVTACSRLTPEHWCQYVVFAVA
jgi:hypothetical protein